MTEPTDQYGADNGVPPVRQKAGGILLSYVHSIDLVIAITILVGCGALYYVTTTFEEVSVMLSQNIPPEYFPRLVLYLIGLLALLLPFEHISHARRGSNIDAERSERIKRMPYFTAVLLILLVTAMPYLGVILTMAGVCVLLPLLWGERRWRIIVPFAVVFPLVVTIIFNKILLVYFEPGVLGISL